MISLRGLIMKKQIKKMIDDSNSILLLTHENPDGDAIGSVLSFYHYLISINKSVDMVVLDIPKVFDFLPSIDKVVDNTNSNYDLGIILDCASKERIGQNDILFNKKEYLLKSVINTSSLGLLNVIFTSNPFTGTPLCFGG